MGAGPDDGEVAGPVCGNDACEDFEAVQGHRWPGFLEPWIALEASPKVQTLPIEGQALNTPETDPRLQGWLVEAAPPKATDSNGLFRDHHSRQGADTPTLVARAT